MILLAIIMQVQVDWRAWLYGMRPGKRLGQLRAESFIMTPEGFFLGVGHSRPYPDIHAVAWALTPDGYTLWQFHQDTVSYDFSALLGCCASPQGKIYAGGYAVRPGDSSSTLFVVRLNPLNGFPIWSYTLPDTAASGCGLLALDPKGNLIACGPLWTPSTDMDIHAISLDTAGNPRWYFRYDGPWHEWDQAHDMVVNQNSGSIYLTGVRTDSTISCTETKPMVIKLDTAGNIVWISTMDFLKNREADAGALFSKWIYLAGHAEGTSWQYSFAARLDTATGSVDWYKEYMSPSEQSVNNLIMDEAGNLYIAGGGGLGAWEVMCLDSLGTEKWRFDADPDESNNFGVISISLDSLGNLFAGGSGRNEEYPVVYKLDTLGNLIWAWKDSLVGYGGVTATGVIPDGQGGVYVQEWFTTSIPDPPYYTNITSVVHLTEGQAIAENPGQGQGIRIAMAPSGFLISGYEGEARVYDPAGRLILTREIKSKALIGPLKPGVYFVVAGRQRAKVAVR